MAPMKIPVPPVLPETGHTNQPELPAPPMGGRETGNGNRGITLEHGGAVKSLARLPRIPIGCRCSQSRVTDRGGALGGYDFTPLPLQGWGEGKSLSL